MSLVLQIKSLIISFIYGIFFAIMFNINYKFLFCKKKFNKIIINLFFNIDIFLLYFLILKYINNGIIHIYFLVFVYLGFLLVNKLTKKLKKFL
jgi:hypothetical protein